MERPTPSPCPLHSPLERLVQAELGPGLAKFSQGHWRPGSRLLAFRDLEQRSQPWTERNDALMVRFGRRFDASSDPTPHRDRVTP